MPQSPTPADDTFWSAAFGGDPFATASIGLAPRWPFILGAPAPVNPWDRPNVPPGPAAPTPSLLPPYASHFAAYPAAPAADANPWGAPNSWIANHSLLGFIPSLQSKPVGSEGLLGKLAELPPRQGFFPPDGILPTSAFADDATDNSIIRASPAWTNGAQTSSSAAPDHSLNPTAVPASTSSDATPARIANDPTSVPSFGANRGDAAVVPQTSLSSDMPYTAWVSATQPWLQGAEPSRLPDWWIANRSLLGFIPSLQSKPVGADGLLGQLAPSPASSALPKMPGLLDALFQGVGSSFRDVAQTAGFVPRTEVAEPSPAAAPLAWSDLTSPWGQLAPKLSYRLGRSSPTLAAGVAGGAIGSVIGPEGTFGGALIGGSLGSAAWSAAETLGPAYARELQKTPDDPEGAWQRAWEQAAASGVFSGASWSVFPVRFFQGPVKQLLFQAFGVQPALAVGEKATRNVIEGRPADEGLGEAYAEGTLGTLTPAAGHPAVNRIAQWRGSSGPSDSGVPPPITGSYRTLSGTLQPGWQANHLNQAAVYGNTIPRSDGLTVAMQGDVIAQPGSPHWAFHRAMEEFWEPYRKGNELHDTFATNAQYGEASEHALGAGGFTKAQAADLKAKAAAERATYGLDEDAAVPRIPGRINLAKP